MNKVKDSSEEMMKIRKEIVDFHGEMVLLENYSALNYTGTFNFHMYCYICLFFFIVIEIWILSLHFKLCPSSS